MKTKPKKKLRIEVFERKDPYLTTAKSWFFRIKGGNNQIIAQSEGYSRKANAIKTAKLLAGSRMEVRVL